MEEISVGIVGAGFMGKAHTFGYDNVARMFEIPVTVRKTRLADVSTEIARDAAARLGWREGAADWRAVTRADDVDVVDIVTPPDAHAEIAIDALKHGKHVLCEKPLARTLAEARRVYAAARDASGAVTQVGFSYRSWPAMAAARELIDDGRIGRVLGFRARFVLDHFVDPRVPGSWHVRRSVAGGGAIADMGAHAIDLARYLVGDIARVFARSTTFYDRRPPEGDPVDVDDATDLLIEFDDGQPGHIFASWMMPGHPNDFSFEVHGDRGAVRFSWEDGSSQLWLHELGDRRYGNGFREVIIGPQHGESHGFWPLPGLLGYSDAYVIQAYRLIRAILDGRDASPSFLDGLRVAEVVDAAARSAAGGQWVTLERLEP